MRDIYVFLSVMAIVTGALAAFDRERHLGNGRTIFGLDVVHIGFGAAAGIIGIMAPKAQLA